MRILQKFRSEVLFNGKKQDAEIRIYKRLRGQILRKILAIDLEKIAEIM
ncbi:MAG: hypothetical protein KI793_22875 [Rivularia sp. (in: Bacteria)]|nr:hypothetical protein [Rivularia sp. MS3]